MNVNRPLDAAVSGSLGLALCEAAYSGDEADVLALLDAGASPNAVDDKGLSALSRAVSMDSAQKVALLISRGADVDGREAESGRTSLMDAAWFGNTRALVVLLDAGADPLLVDAEMRRSALHYAASEGLTAEAMILCGRGGLTERLDSTGRSALDLAVESGSKNLSDRLARLWSPEGLDRFLATWARGAQPPEVAVVADAFGAASRVAHARQLERDLEAQIPSAPPGRGAARV